MKSWYVTVLSGYKEIVRIQCLSVKMSLEKMDFVKEKYPNNPADKDAPVYTYHRELY